MEILNYEVSGDDWDCVKVLMCYCVSGMMSLLGLISPISF